MFVLTTSREKMCEGTGVHKTFTFYYRKKNEDVLQRYVWFSIDLQNFKTISKVMCIKVKDSYHFALLATFI